MKLRPTYEQLPNICSISIEIRDVSCFEYNTSRFLFRVIKMGDSLQVTVNPLIHMKMVVSVWKLETKIRTCLTQNTMNSQIVVKHVAHRNR